MLLTIEKLVYGGDGLGHAPADERGTGKAVFVPFVLKDEQVEAAIAEEKPGFARATLERVLSPSGQRVEPPCPYFARCGGCHYQHTGYEHQVEIKRAVLRETLARFAKLEWAEEIVAHRSPAWNYRNRTRLQVRTAPEFAVAYFRHGSHELLPVEQCPISSPLINRAMAAMWRLGRDARVPSQIREIEFFAGAADTSLLVELYVGDGSARAELAEFCEALSEALPQLTGVAVFGAPQPQRQVREPVQIGAAGDPWLEDARGKLRYRISAGSFFQTNWHLLDTMVELVTAGRAGKAALDLYAGAGLFSLPLAGAFERVVAVEASPLSFADLKHNAPRGLKPVHATTEKFLERSTLRPDFVVVDPPRAGLGEKITRALARMAPPRITYVSCDPATLARDLRALLNQGYRVEQIHLVDLFPQTFHIESVVLLAR